MIKSFIFIKPYSHTFHNRCEILNLDNPCSYTRSWEGNCTWVHAETTVDQLWKGFNYWENDMYLLKWTFHCTMNWQNNTHFSFLSEHSPHERGRDQFCLPTPLIITQYFFPIIFSQKQICQPLPMSSLIQSRICITDYLCKAWNLCQRYDAIASALTISTSPFL